MAELRSITELALVGLALVSSQFGGFEHKKHSYVICDSVLLRERDSIDESFLMFDNNAVGIIPIALRNKT